MATQNSLEAQDALFAKYRRLKDRLAEITNKCRSLTEEQGQLQVELRRIKAAVDMVVEDGEDATMAMLKAEPNDSVEKALNTLAGSGLGQLALNNPYQQYFQGLQAQYQQCAYCGIVAPGTFCQLTSRNH